MTPENRDYIQALLLLKVIEPLLSEEKWKGLSSHDRWNLGSQLCTIRWLLTISDDPKWSYPQ